MNDGSLAAAGQAAPSLGSIQVQVASVNELATSLASRANEVLGNIAGTVTLPDAKGGVETPPLQALIPNISEGLEKLHRTLRRMQNSLERIEYSTSTNTGSPVPTRSP